MVFGGFDPAVDRELRAATATAQSPVAISRNAPSAGPLRAGDPVGMSLVRGDLEVGATGTVTHVDGNRVYALGHPFLNLGPTSLPMTRAHVFTILPSLDSSSKIAGLGPVIGIVNQDRATAVAGMLGPGPREVEVTVTLTSDRAPDRRLLFHVLEDEELTPLFTYVSVVNSVLGYERQAGVLSVAMQGTAQLGADGEIRFDDVFAGKGAAAAAANAVATPLSRAVANEFRPVMPTRIDLAFRASERELATTIERIWLDTTRPRLGKVHMLQVELRDVRGPSRVVSLPVTMPRQADGPLTLVVTNAAGLAELEQRDLEPAKPSNWSELLAALHRTRRGNHLYVRLINPAGGSVVGGETLSALPGTVRSVLDKDPASGRAPLARAVVGAWEQRLDVAVRGSRELTVTLTPEP
jgi:hypothetical protein